MPPTYWHQPASSSHALIEQFCPGFSYTVRAVAARYSKVELDEALRAVDSLLYKLVTSKQTMEAKGSIRPGSSQQTLIDRRIAALRLSIDLIQEALDNSDTPEN